MLIQVSSKEKQAGEKFGDRIYWSEKLNPDLPAMHVIVQ